MMITRLRNAGIGFWLLGMGAMPLAAAPVPPWQAVPLVTAAMRHAGLTGGEGAQAIRSLAVSPSDPNVLFMGTDVGGIYRSLDNGHHWQVCIVGWHARGGNAFAVDPRNPAHVLGVGANSVDWNAGWGATPNGVYLSTDTGASWKQVLPRNEGNEWRADSLAWDPRSYDAAQGICTVAYFESRDGGLFKTTDGGNTWNQVSDHGGGTIAVDPASGAVYLTDNSQNGHGFYKSTDGGATFAKINDNATLDVVVIPSRPSSVYITGGDQVLVSSDGGATFAPVGANAGLPANTPIGFLRVSSVNPKEMICNYGGKQWWESYTMASQDGGASWEKVSYNNADVFLPFTQPGNRFVFDPKDPHVVIGTQANGTIMRSSDGGMTFHYSGDGQNAVMVGSSFGFDSGSPGVVFTSFQDFDGAVTVTGGRTWTYCNPSGQGWGGFEYGGFALNARTLWTGDAPSWGGPRTLKVSQDGGQTWTVMNDPAGKPIVFAGPDVSFADPGQAGVCFAANGRSADAGKTWAPMTGCDGVFTASGKTALLGKHGDSVCRSVDHGVTWADITPAVPGGLSDIAVDPARRRVYVASENHVKVYELSAGMSGTWQTLDTPADWKGATHVRSVAVDPTDPAIVYAGGAADTYATDATVIRSTDAGQTWENLTVTAPLASFAQSGGPHEVEWVRVNPATRDLWAAGECFGIWRLPPPAGAK